MSGTAVESTSSSTFVPTRQEMGAIFEEKYGPDSAMGWGPRLRKHFNYFTPEDHYETTVSNLVFEGCNWADVGCGRDIFPSNHGLARRLSERAGFVLGIDPDDNILENPFVDEKFHGIVDDYRGGRQCDIITLRMVAEHIESPDKALEGVCGICKPGSIVVIYTPYKWAPMSILARITPMAVHHFFKKLLWNTEERDTFPVQFKMNTRKILHELFVRHDFQEVHFMYLDDCRTFGGSYYLQYIELAVWRLLSAMGLRYPESCLLGIYRKL